MLYAYLRRTLHSASSALLLALSVCLSANAQPAVGSIHKEFLALGGGSSVPLPEGSWELVLNEPYTQGTANPVSSFASGVNQVPLRWQAYVLRNQKPESAVPLLVVRQSLISFRWGGTGCQNTQSSHFLVNTHGTSPNDLLNKCSRFFSLSNPKEWSESVVQNQDVGIQSWWRAAMPGLQQDLRKMDGVTLMLGEFRLQQFNQRAVVVEAFLYPPRGVRAPAFRQRSLNGVQSPEHEILDNWASIYIESMQKSFFDRKPQALIPLAYAPNLQRGGGATITADATAPAPALPAVATAPALALPPVAAAQAPALAPAATALAPAPARINPPPVSVTATAPDAERQRLETERRALEQERLQVAQQLDAMRQMLAKLQQENAAATAARAQESQARAAPAPAAPVVYANRKALVIGNDNYAHVSKLNNAAADAESMAKSLEAVGYRVTKHVNLDERRFKQVLRDFRQNVQGGDEVLFFFAGHGVQLGNANYLLPVDIRGDGEDQVKDESILLQKVLDEFDEKKAKFTLAVIDACRDNPFKTKGRAIGGRGLAPTSAATGQMVMFSAGAGQQALDRLGDQDKERNGLFTRIFVKEMQKPGLSVDRVLRNVRNEVVRLAKSVGHEQTPALYDQAIGEFYFKQ
jgi:hypothetical protein